MLSHVYLIVYFFITEHMALRQQLELGRKDRARDWRCLTPTVTLHPASRPLPHIMLKIMEPTVCVGMKSQLSSFEIQRVQ